MQFDANIQRKLWETEMDILDVVHSVCIKNGLKYSLGFGTLIGAIRHKGFIPWDDDIDIIMPRDDYNKLIEIWSSEAPEGYILQNKNTNNDFTQNFTKIRKDHTAFIENSYDEKANYHNGIFVDIGPCDRVAPRKLGRFCQYVACAVNLLYSRGYRSGTKGIVGLVERTLLKFPDKLKRKLLKRTEKIMCKWNGRTDCMCFFTDTIANCRRYMHRALFDTIKVTSFENRHYCIIGNPDDFLRVRYGDYMQLPPEEERVWKHHPILIDFEHNYEEIAEESRQI